MSGMLRRSSDLCRGLFVLIVIATSLFLSPPAFAAEPSDIESNLSITIGGAEKQLSLPLPQDLAAMAAKGHYGDGKELPDGFRVCPEHAAAGLWSTPSDLANLLLLVGRAWRGESRLFLAPKTSRC
jgi:hypothetical protein